MGTPLENAAVDAEARFFRPGFAKRQDAPFRLPDLVGEPYLAIELQYRRRPPGLQGPETVRKANRRGGFLPLVAQEPADKYYGARLGASRHDGAILMEYIESGRKGGTGA
jgi:hypothetical protein